MAGQPPSTPPVAATPITAAIPPAPTAPAPQVAPPVAAPSATPTPDATPQVAPPPQTLQEVLAARKAALNPVGQPFPPATPPETQTPQPETPPVVPPVENANLGQPPTDPIAAAKDQIFDLMQNNPQQLLAMLQAAQGIQPQQAPAEQVPPTVTPEQYSQAMQVEAQQLLQNRPQITAVGLFGEENANEMGLGNTDFTAELEQFVYATLAPALSNLMSNMHGLRHHVDQQFTQVKPVLDSHQFTEVQREAGKQLTEAFPALGKGDANAVAYADKRFNELAPILLPPEILNNPQSNPREYARIMTSIARIAANEYSALPPANASAAPLVIPAPASVPPEPQSIAPTYRNHLGQFNAQATPRTLDEFNQQRIKTMFPNR